MAGFTTSQDAMGAGAAHVENCTELVDGNINSLRTHVTTMRGGWSGAAAEAFTQLHTNFEGQAKRINDALRAMHEALVKNQQTYAAQEEQETQNVTSLINQINGQ